MKRQPLKLILIGLFMVISIWLVWPDSASSSLDGTEAAQTGREKFEWFGNRANSNAPLKRIQSSEDTKMQRIDSLISHQTLTNHEVAEQLLIIAKDKTISQNVRAEALGHGVILDLPVFVEMAADNHLPQEMASELLQHVINANDHLDLQIRAYSDLLGHDSEEIRKQAKQVLSFILEDDSGQADEATLLQMANNRLKQLETEKPQGE